MPDVTRLCDDLRSEHESLDRIVTGLAAERWDLMTPSEPWTIRDQISHLRFFDEQATEAVADPQAFTVHLVEVATDPAGYLDAPLIEGRAARPQDVLDRWRRARSGMLEAFATIDPSTRIPWYGPPMSPASFISARLMETWAHGQDIVDALGATRTPTDRLRHVAHLGVRARPYSFSIRGLDPPEVDVRVELVSPGGAPWTWGDDDAADRITGPAEDFCLVVTQRRHPADTSLVAVGAVAERWLSIAQCFAGPAGEGRRPGQFATAR